MYIHKPIFKSSSILLSTCFGTMNFTLKIQCLATTWQALAGTWDLGWGLDRGPFRARRDFDVNLRQMSESGTGTT